MTLPDARSERACMNPPNFEIDPKNPSRVIDGVHFAHQWVGAAAMSHDIQINSYRGFKNGKCYELDIRVAYTNFAVYAPARSKSSPRKIFSA